MHTLEESLCQITFWYYFIDDITQTYKIICFLCPGSTSLVSGAKKVSERPDKTQGRSAIS